MKNLALSFVLLLSVPAAMGQETQWQKDHPRRTEVNKRLENQNKRIDQGEKSGKLTPGQAQALHKEDHQIRKEERRDAAKHGGHITKGEQRQLNRQENRESRQIRKEKAGK